MRINLFLQECCCGKDMSGNKAELSKAEIDCHGKSAADACDFWCGLHLPCIDNGNDELACSFGDLQKEEQCYGTGMDGVGVKMECSKEFCCCDMDT